MGVEETARPHLPRGTMDLYRYSLKGRSLSIPSRIIRMTVTASNPDDARAIARMRNPDFSTTIPGGVRRTAAVVKPDQELIQRARDIDAEWRSRGWDGSEEGARAFFAEFLRGQIADLESKIADIRAELAEYEPEQADPMTQAKAREFVTWRGTEVEVV